jgi:hypothetical protein
MTEAEIRSLDRRRLVRRMVKNYRDGQGRPLNPRTDWALALLVEQEAARIVATKSDADVARLLGNEAWKA